jgi:hypothetical protein
VVYSRIAHYHRSRFADTGALGILEVIARLEF